MMQQQRRKLSEINLWRVASGNYLNAMMRTLFTKRPMMKNTYVLSCNTIQSYFMFVISYVFATCVLRLNYVKLIIITVAIFCNSNPNFILILRPFIFKIYFPFLYIYIKIPCHLLFYYSEIFQFITSWYPTSSSLFSFRSAAALYTLYNFL